MEIKKIVDEACKTARSLWEEVFYEDSVQFTDYYFENKAEKNIGYVIGEAPYDAMMFRTPYTLQIGDARKEISYIVGVATREECRHRGYMRKLLTRSLRLKRNLVNIRRLFMMGHFLSILKILFLRSFF